MVVLWKGFGVADTTFAPEVDGVMDIDCAVHWATFDVTDADAGPLPGVQLVAMYMGTLGVVGFGPTDAEGTISMRLPDTTYRVEVYWRNTMVLRLDDLPLDGGDLQDTLTCRVFRITVEVVDRNDDALPDVPVVLEDATGVVVATAITDDDGLVVFQLGEGSYQATGLFQRTYRWTDINLEQTDGLEVNASGEYTLKFEDYPPSVIYTVQFWAIFSLVLIFLILVYVVLLWRSSLSDEKMVKEPKGGEKEEAEDEGSEDEENPTGIEVETNPRQPPSDED